MHNPQYTLDEWEKDNKKGVRQQERRKRKEKKKKKGKKEERRGARKEIETDTCGEQREGNKNKREKELRRSWKRQALFQ